MRRWLLFFCFLNLFSIAQTIEQCKRRFETYLDFHGTLKSRLEFTPDAIYLLKYSGQREMALYADELETLSRFMANSANRQQQKLFYAKGLRKFAARELDSISKLIPDLKKEKPTDRLPLLGYKIAIDPGHFGVNLKEAAAEQKYLSFIIPATGNKKQDTVLLFESQLTFQTARILQKQLEEQGATVMLTRQQAGYTAFGCSYTHWLKHHKIRSLDSLKNSGALTIARYNKLLKSNQRDLFWDFFRDYELGHRAARINKFGPDLTVIIHYNVDEKNAPWKKAGKKDFTMTFIGGAFTPGDIEREENRMDFVRLLVTSQLNHSEELASQTVQNFSKNLGVKIATAKDAEYLQKNCTATPSDGVFCRNLALCRRINSPLVYGEALYQDHEQECFDLMKCDLEIGGIKTSKRIAAVAESYRDAVLAYLKNR